MKIEPLDRTFGAVVTDLQLASISSDEFAELQKAWLEYALLIFPGQHLSKQDQIDFAKRFGPLELECTPISNLTKEGAVRGDDDVMKVLKGNMDWHCDSTYLPVMAKGAVFSAHVVPSQGGETGFADMRASFDVLGSAQQARLQTLKAFHSLHHSQAKVGHEHSDQSEYSGYGFNVDEVPLRSLVKEHPDTGRKSLLIGRHAYGIPGLSEAESESLLTNLINDACQDDRIYYHSWNAGDVVLWDNRCLLHRACPWNLSEPRVMFHSRIAGHPDSESESESESGTESGTVA